MEFVFVDKPAGVTTHSSLNEDDRQAPLADLADGFQEWLSARFSTPLFVAHRLDRETTGALVMARDSATAERLRVLFESRDVEKTYLFLTDRKTSEREFERVSFIERRGSEIVSLPPEAGQVANASTQFRWLEESEGLTLWEARPHSGRPHQIRLHAREAGIAILGDERYDGGRFPALCLHSQSLSFPLENGERASFTSPAPRWFLDRSIAQDPSLAKWLVSIDRRERLLRSGAAFGELPEADRTLRWIHTEGDPLRIDELGPVAAMSWFDDYEPSAQEWASIRKLAEISGDEPTAKRRWDRWQLRLRGNRGKTPNAERTWTHGEPPEAWVANENGLKFEMRLDSGLSPGLFLDQRRNRAWVKANAAGLRVLNLFCYTGGFSVAAASGGAAQVVSVDVSKPFIEWVRRNFALNELNPEGHEFRAIDARKYLDFAVKKSLAFDLVICDPPSFGRSDDGVFRIEQDFAPLLETLMKVTAPKGRILFASNFEKWSIEDFATRVAKVLASPAGRGFQLATTPSPDWDFELPREQYGTLMKSFFIVQKRTVSE